MSSSNAIIRMRRLLLSKKTGTFFICLGIASLLWLVHALNRNYKYTLHVPVTFLNLPQNKLIVGDLPEVLDVDIKTSGLKLAFISLKKLQQPTTIDFNHLKNNEKSESYAINNGHFNLKNIINFDVEMLKIRPDTLFFSTNKGHSKLLPVKANLKAICKSGYSIISKPIITPAFITVSGDSVELAKTDTVYTYYLNLKDVHQNYSSNVTLKKSYSSLHYNVKDVKLSFEVDKLTESSIQIPIQILNNPNNKIIKLLPNHVTLTYLVAMKDYETITPNSFKATVNYQDINEKQTHLKVEIIRLPSEIKIIKTVPNTISYLIYK